MVKKFTIPFASQGDANDIPDALQVDGKVSFTQGFGYDYERPYDDPQAKDIAREDMNGLFKAITSAVGELQTLGASEWSNAISYPKGAIVYHEKDLYISQVDDNQNTPPQSWTSIKNIAEDSLKKVANLSDLTDKATARSNLGLGNSATLNKTDVLGTSTSLVATQKLVNDTRTNLNNNINNKIDKTSITNELGDSTELVASQALVNSLAQKIDDVPVDKIFAFDTATPPKGYIARNGQAIDRNTMPKLYARYGANMPDDRNRVHRMHGSLTEAVGSTQEDAMQEHIHTFGGRAPTYTFKADASGSNYTNYAISITDYTGDSTGRTATETRVKSRIVIFCNKIQ